MESIEHSHESQHLFFQSTVFLLCKVSLMIKPLPNGKENFLIVQMCRCNLLLEVIRFFLEDLWVVKKNPVIFEIICKVLGVM